MTRYDNMPLGQRLARDSRRNLSSRAITQGYKSRLPVVLEAAWNLPGWLLGRVRQAYKAHIQQARKARRAHGWNE